jgi:hypothetical protein
MSEKNNDKWYMAGYTLAPTKTVVVAGPYTHYTHYHLSVIDHAPEPVWASDWQRDASQAAVKWAKDKTHDEEVRKWWGDRGEDDDERK